MADMCRAGLWSIQPELNCPECGATPAMDCAAPSYSAARRADASLLALCVELQQRQVEWQRLWAATPDGGADTPEDVAFRRYSDWTWPGVRASDSGLPAEQDVVRQLLDHRATTPEGRQAKAAAVLAIDEAGAYCDSRDDSIELLLDVLREAAARARVPLGNDTTPIASTAPSAG